MSYNNNTDEYDNPIYNVLNTCNTITEQCTCTNTCTATAPTGVTVTQGASATSANASWTPGTGGTS